MRAGLLNRRLRLQKVVMTADSEGVSSENWIDLATIWAHIDPVSALEAYQAGQTQEKISHRITIRWRPDVTVKQRFLYSSNPAAATRLFLIQTMLNHDEDFRELDCMCLEFVTTAIGAT